MGPESRRDFVRRTLFNLKFIENQAADDGPFEVTQLINSFLLVVLQNWDDLEDQWPHLKKSQEWPQFVSSHEHWQPHQQVGKFRDAFAHGCFTADVDNAARIGNLRLWTCVDGKTVDWHAIVSVTQMRKMLTCFVVAAEAHLVRGLRGKRLGDPCDRSQGTN